MLTEKPDMLQESTEANLTIHDSHYSDVLADKLGEDLDFHDADSGYATHNLHAFPAKFPPQLPRKFIDALTRPGDVVLDPMVGSGTTIVEAYLSRRYGLGFDIDPLALMLSQAKTTPLREETAAKAGAAILEGARFALKHERERLEEQLATRYNGSTRKFMDYWFAPRTQLELQALINEIQQIDEQTLRTFFQLVFSGVIITKTGGVSLAFDLAHTRPHRAKIVKKRDGTILLGHDLVNSKSQRVQLLTKVLRPALPEFEKRLQHNLSSLLGPHPARIPPDIRFGDAQNMALEGNSVDLIVTSPPYAANAIDYMRAHKFSLVWMGYSIRDLSQMRGEYIGGEATSTITYERLPELPSQIVATVGEKDEKRGKVVHRYYSEMTRTLREMYRVLKPGKAAIMVVGTSVLHGVDILIGDCLTAIGKQIGFEVPKIGYRDLDRDRRMLPASAKKQERQGQIQQRMHDEYVIGFYKPR
jgi:DNA modification methylase